MRKYKCKFDYQFTDLLIIIVSCIGFYLIPIFIFSILGGFVSRIIVKILGGGVVGAFNIPIFGFLSMSYLLGIAIGSVGSFIYVVRYIVEGIEIYSIEDEN